VHFYAGEPTQRFAVQQGATFTANYRTAVAVQQNQPARAESATATGSSPH
jgi:hypothetical protein